MKKVLFLAALVFLLGAVSSSSLDNPLYPYPSPEDREREVHDLAREFPGRVEVFQYGESVQGRPLTGFRIHRAGQEKKPAAWMGANIHGNEWIGNRMVMNISRMLLEDDGPDPLVTEAMDKMDFYVTPCINPDGYQKTWDNPGGAGEVATMGMSSSGDDEQWKYCRKNHNGVDLNRNWPIPGKVSVPIDWAGSPDPDSVHYRGPEPLSEPENAALDNFFAEREEIFAGVSWHSMAAVLFPPHCPSRACMRRYSEVCKAFRQNQAHRKYPRLQSRVFDTYTGELEDWAYAQYGILAMDVEISTARDNKKDCQCDDLFWSFNPKTPEYWLENDSRAAIAAMLRAYEITGGKRVPPAER